MFSGEFSASQAARGRDRRNPPALVAACLLSCLAAFMVLPGPSAQGDEIVTHDGRTIQGKVVEQAEDRVRVRTAKGQLTILRSQIREIRIEEMSEAEAEGDVAAARKKPYEALRLYLEAQKEGVGGERLAGKMEKVRAIIGEQERALFQERFDEAMRQSAAGNRDEARRILRRVQEEAPPDGPFAVKARQAMAYQYFLDSAAFVDKVEYQKAIEALEGAVTVDPTIPILHLEMARLRDEYTKNAERALADCRTGLELADKQRSGTGDSGMPPDPAIVPDKAVLSEACLLESRFREGEILFRLGRFEEAAQHFLALLEDAAESLPKTTKDRAIKRVEEVLMDENMQPMFDRAKVLTQLEALLKWNPASVRAWFLKGKIHLDDEDTTEAIAALDEAIRIDDTSPDLHYYRARAYLRQNKIRAARRDLNQELTIRSTYGARCLLGEVCLMGSEYDQAAAQFDKAIEMEPDQFPGLLGRANTHRLKAIAAGLSLSERSELLERAEKDITKVLGINEKNRRAILEMSRLLKEKDEFERAAEYLGQLIEDLRRQGIQLLVVDDRDILTKAYIERGDLNLRANNLAQAENDFQEALNINPDSGLAMNKLGLVAEKRTDFQQAAACYQKAVEMEPENASFELSLGILHHQFLKEYDKAIEYYETFRRKGGMDTRLDLWIKECQNALKKR
jgi:tetratricopeptide (TPR) repeat protein